MINDTPPLAERVKAALDRIKVGHGQMRIPPDATDPDMVIVAQRDRIATLEASISQALEHFEAGEPLKAEEVLRAVLGIPEGP